MRFKFTRLVAGLALAILTSPAVAAQNSIVQPVAGPHSMSDLNTNYMNPALESLLSNSSGATAPGNGPGALPMQFQWWWDTSTTPPTWKVYDDAFVHACERRIYDALGQRADHFDRGDRNPAVCRRQRE